ncbi:hypothetical protein Ssi03_46010 [Sphaerisporangium siamense]|uniref:Uncharacterized protein n=1 Tax=Sphaerisporangium siamense TaxID=795645 RepID=A0A7W7G681_9ACTN|nr:hypothetical protein [Sphaerisporangium siamense]MBB4699263.1 hypothetical protein [Sphaerisporangium siamense]GII86611.1 hypothetical protein Ssi03_46010 [Sphaerisporangium siamense]
MSDLQSVARASRQYEAKKAESEAQIEAARESMFDVWAAAAMAGYSPEEIAQNCGFSAAYVRRVVRERGVEPAARGPKRKK